jgi:hypothetical protein
MLLILFSLPTSGYACNCHLSGGELRTGYSCLDFSAHFDTSLSRVMGDTATLAEFARCKIKIFVSYNSFNLIRQGKSDRQI